MVWLSNRQSPRLIQHVNANTANTISKVKRRQCSERRAAVGCIIRLSMCLQAPCGCRPCRKRATWRSLVALTTLARFRLLLTNPPQKRHRLLPLPSSSRWNLLEAAERRRTQMGAPCPRCPRTAVCREASRVAFGIASIAVRTAKAAKAAVAVRAMETRSPRNWQSQGLHLPQQSTTHAPVLRPYASHSRLGGCPAWRCQPGMRFNPLFSHCLERLSSKQRHPLLMPSERLLIESKHHSKAPAQVLSARPCVRGIIVASRVCERTPSPQS